MENAIVNFHQTTAVQSVDDLDAALGRGRGHRPQAAHGGTDMLRIDQNTGLMVFGPDNIEVQEGSLWAVNPYTFKSGWVCWADPKMNNRKNEKLGEVMGLAIDSTPDCPELTEEQADKGGEWKEQIGIDLICITGEDKGHQVLLQNSSNGALKCYEATYDAVLYDRPSKEHCFAIVELQVTSYFLKMYNKTIYEPVLKIVDWANEGQELLSGGKAEAPVKGETPEADEGETEAAPEAQAEATPKRRRRRVTS